MIHHISIPAYDPLQVGRVLADLTGGRLFRFPGPTPQAFMVVSDDRHGTAIEIYRDSVMLAPGEGEAPVRFVEDPEAPRLSAFHAMLTVPMDHAAIVRIGGRAGWRTKLLPRGAPGQPPAFHVVELWVENRLMLELTPAHQLGPYLRTMNAETLDRMGLAVEPAAA